MAKVPKPTTKQRITSSVDRCFSVMNFPPSPTSMFVRTIALLSLLVLMGCQSTSQPSRQDTPDVAWSLYEGSRIGQIERVMTDGQLVVIALRHGTHRNPPRSGTALESRSLQYQQTSTLEAGPHPTSRYLTARIIQGHPQPGDLVLLAPAVH